jgi:hypothetical protein
VFVGDFGETSIIEGQRMDRRDGGGSQRQFVLCGWRFVAVPTWRRSKTTAAKCFVTA